MSEDEAGGPKSSDAAATPEGHTQEKPGPHEAGKPGAPAHDAETVDDHDDDQGHGEPRLGPIDWAAWAYALAGLAVGLVVAAVFLVKTA